MRKHNEKPDYWYPKDDGEWYSRGYLPHRDNDQLTQSITIRLSDTLPRACINWLRHKLQLLESQLIRLGEDNGSVEAMLLKRRFQYIESFMDAGYGECLLRDDEQATIVCNALKHFDGERYDLISWCIMPNHVHVIVRVNQGTELETIVHSWKSYTAKKINASLSRTGTLWAREFHDRYIRDESHMLKAISYVENNPVKAGLVKAPDEWKWSSAYQG